MRLAVFTLAALGLAGSAGAAASPCKLDVFFVDQDARTNIRAAPSSSAKVIARVDPEKAVATIVESRNGWFRTTRVTDFESDGLLYRGSGWLHASVLGLSVAGGVTPRLYAAPSTRSAVLQKLTPDGNML